MKKFWKRAAAFLFLSAGVLVCSVNSRGGIAPEELPYLKEDFLAGHVQRLYNDQNGMEVNEVNDICQTSDGYIWIASYNGLTRYDGKQFDIFNTHSEPPIASSGILSVYPDSKGRLWIGSNDNGLLKMENGVFQTVESDNLGKSVRRIVEDGAGKLYAATNDGVGYVTEDGRLMPLEVRELEHISLEDLETDHAGNLWMLSTSGELYAVKEKLVMAHYSSDQATTGRYTSLFKNPNGGIYIGTASGKILRLSLGTPQEEIPVAAQAEGLKQINGFYQDSEGRIWVCADSGLGYLDRQGNFTQVKETLINRSMEHMIQDYEGSYWIASSRQGILKFSGSKFYNVSLASGLSGAVVNSTKEAWGNLYIATDDGLQMLNQAGEVQETPLTDLLDGVRVRQLYLDSQDRLWISTYETYGLLCVNEDGSYENWNIENGGLPSNAVRSVLELSDGSMAVATGGGISILRDGNETGRYGVAQGLTNPVILSLCEDISGRLFAGSDGNGIYILDLKSGQMEHVTVKQGLTTGVILRMALDPQKRGIWVSTGNQLDFYDFQTGGCGPAPVPLYTDSNIFDIKFLSEDRLLMLTAKGLLTVDLKTYSDEGGAVWKQFYDRDSGLSSTITANSWSDLDSDGILYLCLNPGVNAISVHQIDQNNMAPRLAVRSVLVDGVQVAFAEGIVLSPDVSRITIDFSVLSYLEQSKIQVKYQLLGFDKRPVTAKGMDISSVSYTNLPGGEYEFVLEAVNGDGIKSQSPISLRVMKEKRLNELPMFWVLSGAGTVCVIFFVFLIYLQKRTKALKQQQEGYRKITEQSLHTIAKTIDAKDSNTNGHSVRVAEYARELARRMHFSEKDQEKVYYSALLHDIGKIGIPDAILNKPGQLTAEEFEIMREHASIGGEILKDFKSISDLAAVVQSHHENYGGGGYPNGLKGDDILLASQIIRVADAYDAMASKRSYRDPMNRTYILSELKKYSGKEFNPKIAALMIQMIEEGYQAKGPVS